MKWQTMIGNIYGDMLVIRRATAEETSWKSHETPLWVKCVHCGHEWSARRGNIEKGMQCPWCHKIGGRGHVNTEIIGKRYGMLTILGYDNERNAEISNSSSKYIKCKCDCGKIISVQKKHVIQGRTHKDGHISYTISCGCATRSSGELNTERALQELGCKIKREVIVPECHKHSPFDIEVLHPVTNMRICFFECDGL